MDIHGPEYRMYRRLRKAGWKPSYAVRYIRNDAKLMRAENEGLIRFARVVDEMYEPDRFISGIHTTTEEQDMVTEEVNKLNSGEWEVWGIVANAPIEANCRCCRRPAEPEETAAWGIVVDRSLMGEMLLRDVEIDQAFELGVI